MVQHLGKVKQFLIKLTHKMHMVQQVSLRYYPRKLKTSIYKKIYMEIFIIA